MSRLPKSFIAALAGAGALFATGCTTIPTPAAQDGAMKGAMTGAMAGKMAGKMTADQCMMMAKPGAADGEQAKPMACKMDCNCPMMQKHDAADTPSAPSLAPPEEHQHAPDAPPAEH